MQINRFRTFWKPTFLNASLYELDNITELMEEAISRKDKELNFEEDYYLGIEGDIPEEIYEGNWEIRNILPSQFRAAIFISYYSLIETELLRICKIIDTDKFLDMKKNKGILKARNFFSEEAKIDLATIPQWDMISKYNMLRNNFVHKGMYSNVIQNNKLVSWISSQNSLSQNNDFICIHKSFLTEVKGTIIRFFENLKDILQDEVK